MKFLKIYFIGIVIEMERGSAKTIYWEKIKFTGNSYCVP